MKTVRFGVVGVDGMGRGHCSTIAEANSREFCLAAVADTVQAVARRRGKEFGVPYFTSAQAMYDSGLVDAVIIATPHYWHPPLTIAAARAGLHVLCEKPLGVTVGPVRAMIAECAKRKVALGTMLQQRTRPVMVKIKQMVDRGQLGETYRISMVCSNWYRTQAYYDRGAWCGTWGGEGGGVLLNQAPHSLDLFQWIGGMPRRIVAMLATREHKIEVENTANAICEYTGGKIGYFYATTAEAPGMEQLIVCGDKGTLVAEDEKLRFGKLSPSLRKHLTTYPSTGGTPRCTWKEVPLPKKPGGRHIDVIRNFTAHLLRGTPLIAPGDEAINELEISNAIYLSGYENRPVTLPVDAAAADRLIARLERQRSTGKGGSLRAKVQREMRRLLKK